MLRSECWLRLLGQRVGRDERSQEVGAAGWTEGVIWLVDDDKLVALAFDADVERLRARHVDMRRPIRQRRPPCQVRPGVQLDDLLSLLANPLHQFVYGSMRHICIAHGLAFLSRQQQRAVMSHPLLPRAGFSGLLAFR